MRFSPPVTIRERANTTEGADMTTLNTKFLLTRLANAVEALSLNVDEEIKRKESEGDLDNSRLYTILGRIEGLSLAVSYIGEQIVMEREFNEAADS